VWREDDLVCGDMSEEPYTVGGEWRWHSFAAAVLQSRLSTGDLQGMGMVENLGKSKYLPASIDDRNLDSSFDSALSSTTSHCKAKEHSEIKDHVETCLGSSGYRPSCRWGYSYKTIQDRGLSKQQ